MGSSATAKRVFISCSCADARYRDLLLGQARHQNTPFEFVDLTCHGPPDDALDGQRRRRIKDCSGLLALISANTSQADAQLWEIRCAYEESLPVLLMFVSELRPRSLPQLLKDRRIVAWSWESVSNFLKKL
jgi:hypothetical protein